MTGQTTSNISKALLWAPVPVEATRLQRAMSWEVLADLGPLVRKGCPGWLFIADELRVHPHGALDMTVRADVLARVRDYLGTRGTTLLVVTVPDKSRAQADQLCGLGRPSALEGRLQTWNDLLLARGIAHLDLQTTLHKTQQLTNQPMFLRTDTHWNEVAAKAAAQTTAATVLAQGVQPVPAQGWQTQQRVAEHGDLIRLAGLDHWQARRPLQADVVQSSIFQAVATGNKELSDEDLFGDAQAPNIALIGTSFSNISNFGRFLEQSLQARIGRFAKDGGDFDGAAQAYFSSDAYRRNPPRLLIWEIPERVLQLPGAHDQISVIFKEH
ncbi:alginate O-acetyltransferase AlgX-related protein [Pigmentiphaga aceris]|nr:cell division protein FtsQ [Pigmentiphaga aceris]